MTKDFVHENQRRAWDETAALIAGRHQSRIVVHAQPQVGKTSLMLKGAVERAKQALATGTAYVNIIAICDANNALKKQTREAVDHALAFSGMQDQADNFIIEHRSNLKHLKLPDSGMLSVFNDEAHIAAAQDAQRDEFMQRVYGFTGNRLIVDVGATSFAHFALHQHIDSPYDGVVTLHPGPSYNSVKHMYEQGRIQQVEKMFNLWGDPYDFLRDRIATLQRRGGYTIIRATGKRHLALIRALRLIDPFIPIIEADMFKLAVAGEHISIADIPAQLCKKPDKPTVLIVRGALRVGIVLPPQASQNICEMIDTNSARADTVTQSLVGRNCGYGKRNDTHTIYTNLRDIETVIDFYDNVQGAIPVGLKNSGATRGGSYRLVSHRDALQMVKNGGVQVSKCSANNEHDVADHVSRNVNTWHGRLVQLDGPNDNFKASWSWLKATKPQLIGQHVTFDLENPVYDGAAVAENFLDLKYMASEAEEADAA